MPFGSNPEHRIPNSTKLHLNQSKDKLGSTKMIIFIAN